MLSKLLKLSLAAVLIVTTSAEEIQTVDLTPGLWSVNTVLNLEGRGVVHNKTDEHCISEAEASQSVQSILSELTEGDCDLTNFEHTLGSASIDMVCRDHESQAVSEGTLNISYTSTEYTVNGNVTITGPGGSSKTNLVTRAKRIAECS